MPKVRTRCLKLQRGWYVSLCDESASFALICCVREIGLRIKSDAYMG